jgi:hypothetical protein
MPNDRAVRGMPQLAHAMIAKWRVSYDGQVAGA